MSKAYCLISTSNGDVFRQAVENYMAAGWEPQGGVVIDRVEPTKPGGGVGSNGTVWFYQAMIHPNPDKTMRLVDYEHNKRKE